MKVIILAAGQGSRLRPLTDTKPKCMVDVNGRSILSRQLAVMKKCSIEERDIYVMAGYRGDVIAETLKNTDIHILYNKDFETTNMVYTLMCARELFEKEEDILISYGDIIYTPEVLEQLLKTNEDMAVVVDNGWYAYWAARSENPLEDAETLKMNEKKYLTEIGKKTDTLSDIQSQYIGLMRFQRKGIHSVLNLCEAACMRSEKGEHLWGTDRTYANMYMTDLLQGLIEEGNHLKAVEINRGWYEIDCCEDLKIAECELGAE